MRKLLPLTAFALAFAAAPLTAQQAPPPDKDKEAEQAPPEPDTASIVVTGARVRQGGAQDIRHFRSIAEDEGR
jgi:Ca-activated chloride channel family protein